MFLIDERAGAIAAFVCLLCVVLGVSILVGAIRDAMEARRARIERRARVAHRLIRELEQYVREREQALARDATADS
jgi:F0F1-type ATP synthase membrane subunit b/b'